MLAVALAWAVPAAAQLSASASLVSQYRYRGMAYSEGRPAAQAGLAWDGDGWFAGAFAAQTRSDSGDGLHLLAYGGRAGRLAAGASWEAGVSAARLTALPGSAYLEAFAGVTGHVGTGQVGGRLYFAPDYFGQGARTVYGEINGSWPVTDRFSAFGHAGALRTVSGFSYPQRADLRTGVAATLGPASLQLALEHGIRRGPGYGGRRNALIASASWHF